MRYLWETDIRGRKAQESESGMAPEAIEPLHVQGMQKEMDAEQGENMEYKTKIIVMLTITLLVMGAMISYHFLQERCYFYLCKTRGTLEYCFGIETTSCKVLKEKCTDKNYISQWNLTCEWSENECECEMKN